MMTTKQIVYWERVAAGCELIGIILVLSMAFLIQFIIKELPCPLCLLQRFGFLAIAFGFLLNLRFGFRPSHYALIILSGLFTSFVSMRQIVLHIIPGTGAYGSPLFGLHLYTWCYIIAMIIVIVTTLLLSVDRQFNLNFTPNKYEKKMTMILFSLVCALIIMNMVSLFLQCGFKECPDDPVQYKLLER